MTTAHATAPRKAAPRGPRFRLATFGIALAVFLAGIAWRTVSLQREIAIFEAQLEPEKQEAVRLASAKAQYEQVASLKDEFRETITVIDQLQRSSSIDDPVPAMHALDRVLASTPNVNVVSINPIAEAGEIHMSLEVTAPTMDAAEKFRGAVEKTGNFQCNKVSGYAPGTLSLSCRFVPPEGGRQ